MDFSVFLIGFALRVVFQAVSIPQALKPICLGLWEGVALSRALGDDDIHQFVSCALHLLFDFYFTEIWWHSTLTISIAFALGFWLSDAPETHEATHRVDSAKTTRFTTIHDSPTSHRVNRIRLSESKRVSRPTNEPNISSGSSPRPVVIAHDQSRALNTLTPPSTPPEPGPSRFPGSLGLESPESHRDDLHTPPPIPTPRALSYTPYLDDSASEQDNYDEEDELQTPLHLELRNLPAVEQGRLLFPEDSASVAGAGDDDASDLSRSGTALSTISGIDALLIAAKAERLRNQAWEEEKQQGRLATQLHDAESRQKIKEAFMLRREIVASGQRVQKLHEQAARRYLKARNLSGKSGVVDVHNLFVPEAVKVVESSLEAAILSGRKELQVIVGRGLHSKDHQPKLGPAITKEMQKHRIQCDVHPRNPGMLILTVPT